MFERTRSDLVVRLHRLVLRFDAIHERAAEHSRGAALATRLGFGASDGIYDEIADKTFEQAGVCGESITALTAKRAWPPMFKKGVKRAEDFACLCEHILDGADAGAAHGKAAARKFLGRTD